MLSIGLACSAANKITTHYSFSPSINKPKNRQNHCLPESHRLCLSAAIMKTEKMGDAEHDYQAYLDPKKRRNPLVPIGAFVTAGVLTAGLISFRRGNSQLGQKLMRARVVAQGATVALMVGTASYYGGNPWFKTNVP